MTVPARDDARKHRTDRTVRVADLECEPHRLALVDRRRGRVDQAMIERTRETVVLRLAPVTRDFGGHWRLVEHAREIEALRLPVRDTLAHVEEVAAADHLRQRTEAELRHDLAQFLGHEEEVVDDVLGLAAEAPAQYRILRRDTHRARVQVTLAHHDAAFDDERRGREAELVGAEQRADRDVAAGLHLAVDLHGDAPPQPIQHERLLRLGEAEFPWRARMLDR